MVVDAGLLTVELLLVAFAGGAIGAAIGGYPAYGLAGLTVAIGEVSPIPLTGEITAVVGDGVVAGTAGTSGLVGYGPVVGPHVAFAGGVAAAAYAGRKGHFASGFEYHAAKRVTTPLGSRPDVLLVGGVFGIVGYWLAQLSVRFSLPWDPVAASVVLSAVLHRIVFGYPLVGRLSADLLDMSPYFRGDDRATADGSGQATASGSRETRRTAGAEGDPRSAARASGIDRPAVEPWLPHQSAWSNVTVLGFVVGVFGGFVGLATGSYFLAFGLTATTLLLLVADVERFPVVHHMALPASIAALALPEAEFLVAVLVGGAFGALAGIAGELAQRVFYAHADTHFDPPSAAILVTTLAIAALDVAGVLQQTVVPTAGLG